MCRLSCRSSPLSWPSRSLSTFMPSKPSELAKSIRRLSCRPSPLSWPSRSDATATKVEFPRFMCGKPTPMRGTHQASGTAAKLAFCVYQGGLNTNSTTVYDLNTTKTPSHAESQMKSRTDELVEKRCLSRHREPEHPHYEHLQLSNGSHHP